jgi:predicted amino acid dehydrogenase
VEKLRCLLEEYRLENYTQELPGRFKKEVIKAATQRQESADRIALGSFSQVLMNIGCQNRLTNTEIQCIFEELGNGKEIPTKNLTKIL